MRRETKTWAGRLAAAAIVAAVLAYVPYHVYARSGLARTLVLKRELAALQAHNRDLSADNERLAREAEALRVDPAAIERVARNELGWVRAGEIVVDLSASTRGPSEGPLDPPRAGAAGQSLSSPTRSSIQSVPRP